jgi:hypothetical protein
MSARTNSVQKIEKISTVGINKQVSVVSVKEDEMCRACSKSGGEEECI